MPRDSKSKVGETRFQMVKERHALLWEKAKADGKVDERMIPLVEFIFSKPEYFTTTTCSGRILLLNLDSKELKKPDSFFAKWHEIPEFEEVWDSLGKKSSQDLWFKQESFVMVIGTTSLENAKKIMAICRNNGVKKAGIMACEEGRFLVEIMGSHYLSFLAKQDSKVIIEREFFEKQFETAVKKLKMNWQMLDKLEKALKKEL
ncbi:MAG: hypothetical protein Q7R70_03805 [Candidatus Diapherotrites archaeon]|nr:hypothetical protein [Candidatus Diapherotrites archaeon]